MLPPPAWRCAGGLHGWCHAPRPAPPTSGALHVGPGEHADRLQPFGVPEVGRQASKHSRIHLQKALDSARGTKDCGEQSRRILLLPRRRQPALEKAVGDLSKERMLGGDSRFRQEGNRIKLAQSRLPGLLKTGPQISVLLQHAQPTEQARLEGALGALLPDAGKQLDEGASFYPGWSRRRRPLSGRAALPPSERTRVPAPAARACGDQK